VHKIDGAGATAENEFTKGNSAAGTPATIVTDDWLNSVQREIVNVIETAGLALNKPDDTQLYQAIAVIVAAATQSSGFSTGDGKITLKTVADPGWILLNDGTIGPSGSGATTRANDDTEALYKHIWNTISDTWAPVDGGRGISADDDWGAEKLLKVPVVLGRALAIAGAGVGLTARSLGQALGEETHLLTAAESGLKQHNHPQRTDDNTGAAQGGDGPDVNAGGFVVGSTGNAGPEDADDEHNNMQPTSFWNVMVKL
jgi:hypothetical protein